MIRPSVNVAQDATSPRYLDIDFDASASTTDSDDFSAFANVEPKKLAQEVKDFVQSIEDSSNESKERVEQLTLTIPTPSSRPIGRRDTPYPTVSTFDRIEDESSPSGDDVEDWMNCRCPFCQIKYIMPSSFDSNSDYDSTDDETVIDSDTLAEIEELSEGLSGIPFPKSPESDDDLLYCMADENRKKYDYLLNVFGPKKGRMMYRAWCDSRARLQVGTHESNLLTRIIGSMFRFGKIPEATESVAGVPMNEDLTYTYKLLEDLLFFMFMLQSSSSLKGWILAIAAFAKFRSDKPLFLNKMIPALKDFCSALFASSEPSNEELLPQSLPEAIETIEDMLGSFNKLQSSPLYEKMHRMCMYAVSYSLFEKAGIKWDLAKYLPMEKHVLKQNFHLGPTFVTNLIDTVLCIIKTGYLVWTEGSADAIFHSGSDYEKWFNEVVWLQNAAKHIGNPEPHGYTAEEFLERLTTARSHGQMILKGAINSKAPGLKQIRSFVYNVESMYYDEIARINTQAHRDVPFSILICGATSVGKGTFSKIVRSYFRWKCELKEGDEYVFTRAPNTEFWDGYKSHQWCLQLDDIAYKNPAKAMEDQTVEEVLQIINSVPFMPNQAHLENKGMTPLKVKLVIATTNKKNLNAYHYFSEPSAAQRRFPYTITIVVLPQFRETSEDGTHVLCSKKSKEEMTRTDAYADCWLITVEKVMPAAKSGQQAKYVVIKKDIRMPEFIEWYKQAIDDHLDKIETMKYSNACIDSIEPCHICELPTCQCIARGYPTCSNKPIGWDMGLEAILFDNAEVPNTSIFEFNRDDLSIIPPVESIVPPAPPMPLESPFTKPSLFSTNYTGFEEYKEMKPDSDGEDDEKTPNISLRPQRFVELPTSNSSSVKEKICLSCVSKDCAKNPCGCCQMPGCKCFSLKDAEPQSSINITSDWNYYDLPAEWGARLPVEWEARPRYMSYWEAILIQFVFGILIGWAYMAVAFPYLQRLERWYNRWRRRPPLNRQNPQSVPVDDVGEVRHDLVPVYSSSDESDDDLEEYVYNAMGIPWYMDSEIRTPVHVDSDIETDPEMPELGEVTPPVTPTHSLSDFGPHRDMRLWSRSDSLVSVLRRLQPLWLVRDNAYDRGMNDDYPSSTFYIEHRHQLIVNYMIDMGSYPSDEEVGQISVHMARLEARIFVSENPDITVELSTVLFRWLRNEFEEDRAFAQTALCLYGLLSPSLQSSSEDGDSSWTWSSLAATGVILGTCYKAGKWTYTKCHTKVRSIRDKIDDYLFDATTSMFWRHLGERVQQRSNYPKMFITLLAGSATLYAAYKAYSYFTKLPATLQSVSVGEPPVPHEKETENVWYRENYPLSSFDMTERSKSCAGKNYNSVLRILEKNLIHVTFKSGDGKSMFCRALCVGAQHYLFNNHCLPHNPELRATIVTQHSNEGVSENKLISVFQSQIYRDPKNDLALMIIPNMPPRKDIVELFAKEKLKVRSDAVYVDKDSSGKTSWRPVQCVARTSQFSTKLNTTLQLWSGVMNENPTQNGDCGIPLVFKLPGGTVVAGIHSLGLATTVSATVVTVDWLRGAISKLPKLTLHSGVPKFSSGKHKVEIGSLHHKSCLRWIDHGEAHVYGSLQCGIRHPKSMVRDTPMFHELKKAGYTKKFTDPELKSWKPWRLAALDSLNTPNNLNYDILMECAKAFFDDIVAKVPESHFKEMKPYDMFTTVNGAPGVKYVDGINRQSSAGSPWNCTKEKLLYKVPARGECLDPVMPVQEVLDLVAHYEAEYAAGRRVYPLYTAHLKDEPVKFKKKKIGKTRVFTGSSLAHSLVVRRFTLPFIRLMHNNRYAFEAAPGTACQSSEWGDMYKYLTEFGEDRLVAGDFKGFDKGMASLLVLLAFQIVIWCCERSGNYTETDLDVLRGIATDTAFPVVNFNGDLIMLHGTNPSGNNLTVEINCLVNSLYMRMCFRLSNPAKEVKTFKVYVHLMTYGDDNIMNVSRKIDWFNHTVIADQLAKVGIEYTMPDKTSESVPFIDMKDATFLKRTWVWNDEVQNYFCPLEEESIEKSLMTWTASRTICPQEQCIAVVSAAVCEYFWYGREIFEAKSKLLRQTVQNIGMETWIQESTFPTWEDLIARWYKQSGIVQPE